MPYALRERRPVYLGETARQKIARNAAGHIPKQWKRRTLMLETRGLLNPTTARSGNYKGKAQNVCYRNGVLQGLIHQPVFSEWLRWDHIPEECPVHYCIACSLHRLLKEYWDENSLTHAPFEQALDDLNTTLMVAGAWEDFDEQADAHEFYLGMMNGTQGQLPLKNDMIDCLFNLYTKYTSKCRTCGRKTEQTAEREGFLTLNFPATGEPRSLEELIRQHFDAEVRDVDCRTTRGRGKRKVPCTGTSATWKKYIEIAPDALTIYLLRYEGSGNKHTDTVECPQNLDLTRYYWPLRNRERPTPVVYELVGVTKHGGSKDTGHYIADVLQPSGDWKRANDAVITPSNLDTARTNTKGKKTIYTPYILHYKRVFRAACNGVYTNPNPQEVSI